MTGAAGLPGGFEGLGECPLVGAFGGGEERLGALHEGVGHALEPSAIRPDGRQGAAALPVAAGRKERLDLRRVLRDGAGVRDGLAVRVAHLHDGLDRFHPVAQHAEAFLAFGDHARLRRSEGWWQGEGGRKGGGAQDHHRCRAFPVSSAPAGGAGVRETANTASAGRLTILCVGRQARGDCGPPPR